MPQPELSYPMPHLPRRRRLFFATPVVAGRWPGALRCAAAFVIPATALVLTGHESQALLVFPGSFAVMYGEWRAYRMRAWVVLTAGVGLLAAVCFGALAGHLVRGDGGRLPLIAGILTMTAVAVVGVYVVAAARLGPPGSFAFVLVYGIAFLAARSGVGAAVVVGAAALGVASSLLVSMAGFVRDRTGPERVAVRAAIAAVDRYASRADGDAVATAVARHAGVEVMWNAWSTIYDAGSADDPAQRGLIDELFEAHCRLLGVTAPEPAAGSDHDAAERALLPRPSLDFRLRRSLSLQSIATQTAVRVLVACSIAGFASLALGFSRPDWAVVSAVLILHQGIDRVHGLIRGLHRFVGTVFGIGVFAVAYHFHPTGLALVAIAGAFMFAIEMFISSNYGIAVAFVTPVALLMGSVGEHGDAVWVMMANRFAETTVGVAVALAALWFVMPHGHRRTYWWTSGRVVGAATELLAADVDASAAQVYAKRRDLQFELIGCTRAGADAVHNEPEWARDHWETHDDVARFGYELLAQHWHSPDGRVRDVDDWVARARAVEAGLDRSRRSG